MLTSEDNELLCRVGSGTPMGDLIRQYWIPALLTSELPEPDCPPVRVRLLGENLIAFRVTSGKVGLIQNHCPHRGASLFFGRNEEEGTPLRLSRLEVRLHGRLRRHAERAGREHLQDEGPGAGLSVRRAQRRRLGLHGPAADGAAAARHRAQHAGRGEYAVQKVLRECNWFQSLEGDIDTGHLSFLHLGAVKPEDTKPGSFDYYNVTDRAPRYEVVDTPFGTLYGAYRPAEPDTYYWRIAHFLFPFYTMIPTGILGMQVLVRAWVPVDDEHVMFWSMGVPRSREGRGSAGGASGMTAGAARRRRREQRRRLRVPAGDDRLARTVPAGAASGQRLPDRSPGPAHLELHRHRGHPPAGPGGHREHGADLRSPPGAPGQLGRDGHPDATAGHRRGPGAARQRGNPARRRRSRDLSPTLRGRDPAARRGLADGDEGAAPGVRPDRHAGGGDAGNQRR